MSWRKHFTPVSAKNNSTGAYSPLSSTGQLNKPGPAAGNYSSYLPDVYTGSPNRIERYGHYNVMDLDSEVNAGLDILAEFCTQKNKQNSTTFSFNFNRDATNSEITILSQYLKQWFRMQKFETRMFQIVRNVFKYGDEIFIRDPETKKLYHIEASKVKRIIVNESEGKTPEQYIVSDINFNFKHLVATEPMQNNNSVTAGGTGYITGGVRGMMGQANNSTSTTRFSLDMDEIAVNAEHIVHISLSEGLDSNYPFGNSLLETIFKVYKQKELLEDAIIIYRVQRAPERRVFYVDVGNMPSHLAMQFVERVKTEIHQRRIPSTTGGQHSIDSTYNPLCLALDTRIPLLDGRVLALSQIIEEFEMGYELWAYSCDPRTGKPAPGRIDWAGVTRQHTRTIGIHLENGNTITCTPDHKFPVYQQGEVQAQFLNSSHALFSFDPEHVYKRDEIPPLMRVKRIEIVDETDTGTLTIDADHVHHDYHNFALDAGVYTKNSINEDFFFPQTCLTLDTQIPLLDGRTISLEQIIDEFEQGETNWVYGTDNKSFHVEPALIEWAGVTRKHTQTVCVELSNGELVNATPDHRFIDWSGTEIAAELLVPGTSLMMSNRFSDENITVKSVTMNNELVDTGDITISSPSNSHWFGLSSGIVVHNSEGRGSKVETLPGGCLPMNTLVKLTDGRELTILEISQELEQGKTLWTYSCHPITGEIKPGLISWAGVTQESAQIMRIYLNNDEYIYCTPEHEFPILNYGFKSADQIKTGDRLIGTTLNWFDRILNRVFGKVKTVKVIETELMDEPACVGTLTIDQDELFHDYHTFALAYGVFTKNSSLGEISDLKYFTNKLVRGLRIPSSYLPTGDDDGTSSYNDGRVGTAYIQELRFNNYCERLQGLLISEFDQEFKRYLIERGVNIDTNMFDLEFEPPQNFASYRQAELDNSRVPTFTTMSAIPFISNRFALKRFLGLTDEEIAENESQWREENDENITTGGQGDGGELRGAGVSSAGIDADMGNLDQELPPEVDDMGTDMDDPSVDATPDAGDVPDTPPPGQ